MRARHLIALVLLLLPSIAEAQWRLPWFGRGRGDGREMPPQPGVIRRELAYRRLRFSVESYPFVTTISAPGFAAPGQTSKWTSFGVGSHVSYRLSPWVAATLDATQADFGGLAATETAELGTRIGPDRWDHRIHPFVDVRLGWLRAFEGYFGSYPTIASLSASGQQPRFGQGFGGVAGFGLERSLTHTLSLTTAFAYSRHRLDTRYYTGSAMANERYSLTARRYIIALRYNPIRWLSRGETR